MTVNVYSIDDAQFQQIMTVAYESTINDLVVAGEMSPDQAQHILDTYILIRLKKGWFGRAVDRLFGKDDPAEWRATLMVVVLPKRRVK